MQELAKALLNYGPLGVIAFAFFWQWRADREDRKQERKQQEQIASERQKTNEEHIRTITAALANNTKAMELMSEWQDRIAGEMCRATDTVANTNRILDDIFARLSLHDKELNSLTQLITSEREWAMERMRLQKAIYEKISGFEWVDDEAHVPSKKK